MFLKDFKHNSTLIAFNYEGEKTNGLINSNICLQLWKPMMCWLTQVLWSASKLGFSVYNNLLFRLVGISSLEWTHPFTPISKLPILQLSEWHKIEFQIKAEGQTKRISWAMVTSLWHPRWAAATQPLPYWCCYSNKEVYCVFFFLILGNIFRFLLS